MLFRVWEKEDSIVAEASAKHTLPLLALKGLHVPLEGVGLHLVKRAGDTLLNGFGRSRRSRFASSVSSQTQLMFDLRPWCHFAFADLFHSVPNLLRFLGR